MTRIFCTYFDHNYLSRGVTLLRSLLATQRETPAFLVLVIDAETEQGLRNSAIPGLEIVRIDELISAFPALVQAQGDRSRKEFLWTLTPCLVEFALVRFEAEWVFYVDADLRFFADLGVVEAEDPAAGTLIHRHHFHPLLASMERNGTYNVGFVGFRRNAGGLRVASDWRTKCIAQCVHDPARGLCGDQGYLDAWPQHHPGVHVIEHPGAGVAPWNVMNAPVTGSPTNPRFGTHPILFYHYHALALPAGWPAIHAYRFHIPAAARRILYAPYIKELKDAESAGFGKALRKSFRSAATSELIHFPFRLRALALPLLAMRRRLYASRSKPSPLRTP